MRRVLVFAVLVLLALVHVPTAASAASITGVGWWTRSPAASAPEGGIAVSNAPDGPVSVAAVRVDLGTTGVSSGTITLPQSGGAAPAGAQLVVCVTGNGWSADAPGAIADAPATTCDGTSTALVANGTTWTANVGDLIGESTGVMAFAVVPSTGSSGIWELQFATPTFKGTARSSSSSSSPASTAFPRTTPTSAAAPSPAAQTFSPSPAPRVAAPTTTAAITPTTIDNFVANVAPESEVAFGGATRNAGTSTSDDRPIGQAVTLTILAAVIGLAGGVAHKVVSARQAV